MPATDVRAGGVPATPTPALAQAMRVLADQFRAGLDPEMPFCVEAIALDEAADRLLDLHHMAARCLPVVSAHNQAEHMMDGFGGRQVRASDALLGHLRQEVGA